MTTVGTWGKIGDIIHTAPVAQKLGATLIYDPQFAAAGTIIDLLPEIPRHYAEPVDWAADDLGIGGINCSHNQFRKDPMKGLNILDWWGIGMHSIDFHAAWAHEELTGNQRYLHFWPDVYQDEQNGSVVFVSNCDDPGMRGYPESFMHTLGDYVSNKGGVSVEVSRGAICVGDDRSYLNLGEVVQEFALARMVISLDTMATGIICQSLNVPIVRLYTGHTRNTGTGPSDLEWDGCRPLTAPPGPNNVFPLIDELWDWRENRGAS